MEISILKLNSHNDKEWTAELVFGERVLSSAITVQDDGELRSFQICNPMFIDMLALNGLQGEFAKRFFSFIQNGEPKLPWCFGEQDDGIINRVQEHYTAATVDVTAGEHS